MSGAAPHERLRALLHDVRRGALDVEQALAALAPSADLGFATVDHDRAQRCGLPEVVFCPGKVPHEAARIAAEIVRRSQRVLLTRAEPAHVAAVRELLPDAVHHDRARCVTVDRRPVSALGLVAVVAAGTADLPVAEEAAVTAEVRGNRVERIYDAGVAGLHRLLESHPLLLEANAIVVVAGMEGALASVVGGLVDRPVIGVPTSVGYGVSLGGFAALLTMLATCVPGVAVVNIDNGFGGACLADRINKLAVKIR